MLLIADSGSTKTQWCLVNSSLQPQTAYTSGINPFYQNTLQIIELLQTELTIDAVAPTIFFYGAGCANAEKNQVVIDALKQRFPNSKINVASDLVGAAYALCQNKAGIACIMGTGSNSCYYNGSQIEKNVSPLGFILGDEGSGAVIGKKLIGDILKNQLPAYIIQQFFDTYKTSSAEIVNHVYRLPFPNRYLAQYAKFANEHIATPEIEQLVINSFDEFIVRNLLQYEQHQQLPVHFIGSIAHFFKAQLTKSITNNGLQLGTICLSPMDGLVKYHTDRL